MLKLRIGDNYLLTTKRDRLMNNYIIYTMSCAKGHNKVFLGFSPDEKIIEDFISSLKGLKAKDIYILSIDRRFKKDTYKKEHKSRLVDFIQRIISAYPTITPHVIKINKDVLSREFKIGKDFFEILKLDEDNLASKLDTLELYKNVTNRLKNIPEEIKVIQENIVKYKKEHKVSDKIITLEDLKPLNLIDSASVVDNTLELCLKPLNIYPSEKFGEFISCSSLRNNKYLYRVATQLYLGNNFGMPGTRIMIDQSFTPQFIETLDHQFDDLFAANNWSNIGYLHFGKGHLCGGEFNDVIAHTSEHGLDYYFMCLKQYLTTANVRDYAGKKVWYYPIYDKEGNLVYCAGLDIMRDKIAGKKPDIASFLYSLTFEEFQKWRLDNGYSFRDIHISPYDSFETNYNKKDSFLELCAEKEPELYERIMKGVNNNG